MRTLWQEAWVWVANRALHIAGGTGYFVNEPRGRPTADRGDELDMDFDDPTSWGERPV